MSNNCAIVRDLFPSYIDGLCSKESKDYIEQHIKSCESCKEILNNIKTELSMADEKDKLERLKAKEPFKKVRDILFICVCSIIILLASLFIKVSIVPKGF